MVLDHWADIKWSELRELRYCRCETLAFWDPGPLRSWPFQIFDTFHKDELDDSFEETELSLKKKWTKIILLSYIADEQVLKRGIASLP